MGIVKVKLSDGTTRLLAGCKAAWLLPESVPIQLGEWTALGASAYEPVKLRSAPREALREVVLDAAGPGDIVLVSLPGHEGRLFSVELQPPPADPLWSAVPVLATDYAGYGGQVPEDKKIGDCSSGCRWASFLEGSGDWLVCTRPDGPRFGKLTWEHQAGGSGCYEWGCDDCGRDATSCRCPDEGTAYVAGCENVYCGGCAELPKDAFSAADVVLKAVRCYQRMQRPASRKKVRDLLRGIIGLLNMLGGDAGDKLAGPLQSTAALLENLERATAARSDEDPR